MIEWGERQQIGVVTEDFSEEKTFDGNLTNVKDLVLRSGDSFILGMRGYKWGKKATKKTVSKATVGIALCY